LSILQKMIPSSWVSSQGALRLQFFQISLRRQASPTLSVWPYWTNIRQLLWKIHMQSTFFGYLFQRLKLWVNFDNKWVGRFFHKLIWSPWTLSSPRPLCLLYDLRWSYGFLVPLSCPTSSDEHALSLGLKTSQAGRATHGRPGPGWPDCFFVKKIAQMSSENRQNVLSDLMLNLFPWKKMLPM
jgi:hypothetical protein